MDIYEALIKDHRSVDHLLTRLERLDPDNDNEREMLLVELREQIIPHMRAEEAVFYNSLRSIEADIREMDFSWHGYEEHMMIEGLLRSLEDAADSEYEFELALRKLRAAITHHVLDAETKLIPTAQRLFTDTEAQAMCLAFEEMKPEIRGGNLMQSALDLISGIIPTRLAGSLRSLSYRM